MPDTPEIVAFLTDYGLRDEFVGVCKGVMLSLAPGLAIIDITHDVPPHDVTFGALALVRAVQYLPEGILLAVVDPGVGTDRRAVAIETEAGYLLGPDNGLLAPAVAMVGGARRAVELDNPDYHLPAPGPTFAGRDVFAPAAGYLAAGVSLDVLGHEVDTAGLTPGLVPLPREEDGRILGEIWWVDHFGNCQLNIGPEELEALGVRRGDPVEVHLGGGTRRARWVGTYADARPSELVLVVDSYGLLALALDRRSAADECEVRAGTGITLVTPAAGDGGSP